MKQIRTVWKELNRSIFVGERLRHNLRVLTYVSLFCAVLGLGLVIMDLVIGEKELVPAFATLLGGLGCAYFAGIKKSRKISVIFPCAFCIVMFTVYALTGFMQGTGIFWTLLMPIGICYFVSVRFGIILSAYYAVLFCVLFYSPLKAHVAMYYDEMIMLRFPILFISVAAFTLISMVQYHRMALRDIDYTQRLTAEEFDVIKSHTTIGGKILERSAGMRGAADVARSHHERYDGGGYPAGRAGEAIALHARVVSVADAYDAMRSDRIYRKGLAPDVIRAELLGGRGTQFDPALLDTFVSLADDGTLDAVCAQADAQLAHAVSLGLIENRQALPDRKKP